jgi:hypothetical protein
MFYGGAAGGGKSIFLLADFLQEVNTWGREWHGIIFRRTYSELEELIKQAMELYLPLGAEWKESGKNGKAFAFPSGADIKFRFLERDKDVQRYQGHQYTWVGFDELGNYPTDFAWTYMISRLRSAAGAPCFIRGTGNPGGPGHGWIKARFIDGFEPGKIYRNPQNKTTKCFIPSRVQDNPYLMKNDPDYINRMDLLPAHQKRALLEGDWDVFVGQAFDEWRRERHVVKPFALDPGTWKKFYSLDWGFAKPFSLGKWAVNGDGRMVRYGEWYGCDRKEMDTGIRMGADEVAARAWDMAIQEGVSEMVADTAIWSKDDDGPSVAEKFVRAGFRMIKSRKDRINGLSMFHQRLLTSGEDGRPMLLVFDHCVDFIRTIPALVPDPNHPEDIDTKLEDHIYDEARYAVMSEFAHNPRNALRKQNGGWNFKRKKEWDPLAINI